MTAIEVPQKKGRLLGHGRADKELQARRAQQELRLKSRFESIFEKYERDFTGLGDEIDLETGEIVVDNGHIQSMKYERDIGDGIDGHLVDVALSDSDNSEDGILTDAEDDDTESMTSASVAIVQEESSAKMTAFAGLDDYDELGDAPLKADVGIDAEDNGDLDELAMTQLEGVSRYDTMGTSKRRILDDAGIPIEPKWVAPPLPHERSRLRPVQRRFFPALSLKIRRNTVDLSDWNQKSSVWDNRAGANKPAGIVLDDEWSHRERRNEKDQFADESLQAPWTSDEEAQLRGLKASVRLSDQELVKYFPGRTASELASRWNHIKASDQLQRELNARLEGHPASDAVEHFANHDNEADRHTELDSVSILQGEELRSFSLNVINGDDQRALSFSNDEAHHHTAKAALGQKRSQIGGTIIPSSRPARATSNLAKPKSPDRSVLKKRRREIPDSDSSVLSSSPIVSLGLVRSSTKASQSSPIVHIISDSEDEASSGEAEALQANKSSGPKRQATSKTKHARSSRLGRSSAAKSPLTSRLSILEPKRIYPPGIRVEVPDSQPSQPLSSAQEPSTPSLPQQPPGTLRRPGTTFRKLDSLDVSPRRSDDSSRPGIATPKSFRALRAAGSSQRSAAKKQKQPASLSQLCDEQSDDDLGKPLPESMPSTSKKPASTPLALDAIPREALECSDDELG